MEISQFTYMQQIGGVDCRPVAGEITYGLERLALYIQGINEVKNLDWNGGVGDRSLTYGEVDFVAEEQFSAFNLEFANTEMLFRHFNDSEAECKRLITHDLPLPAYDYCISASHLFNLLNSRGVISVTERASYIARVRNLTKICVAKYLEMYDK